MGDPKDDKELAAFQAFPAMDGVPDAPWVSRSMSPLGPQAAGGQQKRGRESQDTIIEPLSNPHFPVSGSRGEATL